MRALQSSPGSVIRPVICALCAFALNITQLVLLVVTEELLAKTWKASPRRWSRIWSRVWSRFFAISSAVGSCLYSDLRHHAGSSRVDRSADVARRHVEELRSNLAHRAQIRHLARQAHQVAASLPSRPLPSQPWRGRSSLAPSSARSVVFCASSRGSCSLR